MTSLTREHVLELIRDHLADDLDLDPSVITEETRFKEDLVTDSLDIFILVQELADTYGVPMPDERDGAGILTVGAAVDYVLAHDPAIDEPEHA